MAEFIARESKLALRCCDFKSAVLLLLKYEVSSLGLTMRRRRGSNGTVYKKNISIGGKVITVLLELPAGFGVFKLAGQIKCIHIKFGNKKKIFKTAFEKNCFLDGGVK